MRRLRGAAVLAAGSVIVFASLSGPAASAPSARWPIRHVVVIYQENHSFDNVLGRLCVITLRCDGAVTGKISSGQVIPLPLASDVVPKVDHSNKAQTTAINHGAMDGWNHLKGCDSLDRFACYQSFFPEQIPNISALAVRFTISDRTFEDTLVPSFGSHTVVLAGQLGGFTGNNPKKASSHTSSGWGCDSHRDAPWRAGATLPVTYVPSCFPDKTGRGPYRASPVKWIPTIMDRMDHAGLSWRMYEAQRGDSGYVWAGCTYFAECLLGPEHRNVAPSDQVITDAKAGRLPAVSFVFPRSAASQHNKGSMVAGDNWIGDVVGAIESGPDWKSTAIFLTWDDCGCFYDHVVPPSGLGIREPMIIVSPYAKPFYTDTGTASFTSMLAFIEHNWGLKPLTGWDRRAYDYTNSFDFSQQPLPPIPMVHTAISPDEQRWLRLHPIDPDAT